MRVKELPSDDRPREKLILRGPQSLNDAELLAIILRTGTKGKSVITLAYEVLAKFGNLNLLFSQTLESIKRIPGIGKDKAATLIAAFELSRRVDFQKKWESNKKIKSPQDIAEIFIPKLRDEMKEFFYVVCLNSANSIIKSEKISEGTLNSSLVHPREVFKVAIDNRSANIILIHNHPSGNLEPSNEDIKITKNIVEAGKILNIGVYDHLIIAGNNYLSFVEKRLI
ncbi:DNA repair protein RadC [Melioribacteraceae bacterium 4301-Me]|uniref:RadC family protein n=1 Tax=Pyranulibacter aquaticus TaxID=3163344 RepID=UPI00359B43C8